MRSLILAAVVLVAAATRAEADVPASMQVDPGSTAVVELAITITGADGTETQVDSAVVPIGGGGGTRFQPDFEPFTGQVLDTLVLQPGGCTLSYDFFCNPLYGCITLTVNLSNLSLTLLEPVGASIVGDQIGWGATWRLQGDYSISSVLFDSAGAIDTVAVAGLNGRISVGNGGWRLDQMLIGSIESDVPSDGLPAGLTVRTRTSLGLGGAALAGNYTPPPPAACGNPGWCNEVHRSPGCDLVACCDTVCGIDPACCEITWDAACVQTAVSVCDILPVNDLCSDARPLGLGRFPFTTENADNDGGALPSSCFDIETAGQWFSDVWFTHTTAVDNGIAVSTCGHAGFDTRIAVYSECGGVLIACSDDEFGCPGGTSRTRFYGTAGETYLIRVGGKYGEGVGEIDIAWTDAAPAATSLAAEWPVSAGGNGHSYAVYSLGGGATWNDAVAAAQAFGGHAVTISSAAENDFVRLFAPPPATGNVTAIGLRQLAKGSEPDLGWEWITGEPFVYAAWAEGEPNDAGPVGEDVAVMAPSGLWNDIEQSVEFVVIEWDTPPALDEIIRPETGARYRAVLSPTAVTWSQAAAEAAALGGKLASFETEDEAAFVYDRLVAFAAMWSDSVYNGGPWVGLRLVDGAWTWESGAPLDWSPWQPGEPNGTGDVASFYSFASGPSFGLDDTFDWNSRRAFIVEFEPDAGNPADLNGDGVVGAADLTIMLDSWGACATESCPADLDGDGFVGGTDLASVLAAWGQGG